MNLTHLKIGEKAQIDYIEGVNAFWLIEKGLRKGLEFELFQQNGNNCVLRLVGGKIAIRTDLRKIKVKKCGNNVES